MQEIQQLMKTFIKELEYEPIQTMFERIKQGKFLRSKLMLSIARNQPNFEAKKELLYTLCAVIELIHLASLLHDDVLDEAKLRRGVKSINAEFGAKNAIMLGDILYSKAFFELSKFDKELSSAISNAVVKLSKGELMDINLSQVFNDDEEKYLQMLYFKTASLIEAASFCAAFVYELDTKAFSEYGKNLGLAFQIVDDILDITGDEKELGKPAMNDFKEGKSTLPYIYLYQNSNEIDRTKLQSLFKKELNEAENSWLKEALKPYILQAKNKVELYANEALKAIKKYQNQELEAIITAMIKRSF